MQEFRAESQKLKKNLFTPFFVNWGTRYVNGHASGTQHYNSYVWTMEGEKKTEKREKIMSFLVATKVVATQPSEWLEPWPHVCRDGFKQSLTILFLLMIQNHSNDFYFKLKIYEPLTQTTYFRAILSLWSIS